MNIFKKIFLTAPVIFMINLFAPSVVGKKATFEASKVVTAITPGTVAARKAAIEGQQKAQQVQINNPALNKRGAINQGTVSSGTFINKSQSSTINSVKDGTFNSGTFKQNTAIVNTQNSTGFKLPGVHKEGARPDSWNTILRKEEDRIAAEKIAVQPIYERPVVKVTEEPLYAIPQNQKNSNTHQLPEFNFPKPQSNSVIVRDSLAKELVLPIVPPRPAKSKVIQESPPPRPTAPKPQDQTPPRPTAPKPDYLKN